MWTPSDKIPIRELIDYCNFRRSFYSYRSFDRALYALMKASYDKSKALDEVKHKYGAGHFLRDEVEMSRKESLRFKKALAIMNKDFVKIQKELFPDKAVSELVEYYYLQKWHENYKNFIEKFHDHQKRVRSHTRKLIRIY